MDKSRKSLSHFSKEKFSNKKRQMVPSRVKDTTSTANTDSMEPSFGKPKTGVSRPLEQGIAIREPLPQTHSRMQADAEAYGENKNFDYKRKRKRKFSSDDPIRDSAHSTLKRATRAT